MLWYIAERQRQLDLISREALPKPSLTLSLSFTIYFQSCNNTTLTFTKNRLRQYNVLSSAEIRRSQNRIWLSISILEQIQLVILLYCIFHPIDFYHFSSSTSGKSKAKAENGNIQIPEKQAEPLNLTQKKIELWEYWMVLVSDGRW